LRASPPPLSLTLLTDAALAGDFSLATCLAGGADGDAGGFGAGGVDATTGPTRRAMRRAPVA
jgi:hypothetical protein